MKPQRTLLIIGPTTSGKTKVALEIAKRANGEIINGWKTPLFKGLPFATAYIDLNLAKNIAKHLYEILDPLEKPFTPKKYIQHVERITLDILSRGRLPIIEGGNTGYLKMLLIHNKRKKQYAPIIGITWHDKATLHERIEQRVDGLIKKGLIQEVKRALKCGYRNTYVIAKNCLTQPLVEYFDGKLTLREAKHQIVEWTLQVALLQLKELKALPGITWIKHDPSNIETTVETILSLLGRKNIVAGLQLLDGHGNRRRPSIV